MIPSLYQWFAAASSQPVPEQFAGNYEGAQRGKEFMGLFKKIILFSLAACVLALPLTSSAGVFIGISVGIAPPPLPVYVQPPCPNPGYLWTPGFWAYGPDGYYWVPGTWVEPPTVGLYWTPGYWGWGNGAYFFHAGYWGPTVGFYGGVNYGFGYTGIGFAGGRWDHGYFAYNRSVTNINITNVHVYNETVINNTTVNRVSYNGPGGISRQPTPEEQRAASQPHRDMTPMQTQHVQLAQNNPGLRYANNHGAPTVAATAKPAAFSGPGVVKASAPGGKFNPAAARPASQMPKTAAEASHSPAMNSAKPMNTSRPPVERGAPPMKSNTMANHSTMPETVRAPAERPAQRPMQQQRSAPAERPMQESRPAPQQHMAQPHAAAAQHMSQPHPAPQHEAAPREKK